MGWPAPEQALMEQQLKTDGNVRKLFPLLGLLETPEDETEGLVVRLIDLLAQNLAVLERLDARQEAIEMDQRATRHYLEKLTADQAEMKKVVTSIENALNQVFH